MIALGVLFAVNRWPLDLPMTRIVLTTARWTRYGKDRLYVKTENGEPVGWLDLKTGVATVERQDLAEAFQEAVQGHGPVPTTVVRPASTADVPAATQPDLAREPDYFAPPVAVDRDLALNRPGQGVRAEADALLADMKAESRVGTFLKRAFDVKTDERAYRVGAAGEEAVGPRLERLTKRGWHVLHSIPVGERGADIDHLLIGAGGIYTINTKNHPGKQVWVGEHAIKVGGHSTRYLPKSRFEAERVRKVLNAHLGLDLPVRAVLVFLTGTVIPQVTIKQMPDVLVLDRMDIPGIFKRAPGRLTPEVVEQVYGIARRASTWSA